MGYYHRYTGARRRKKRHILLGMLLLLLVLALAAGGLWLYSRRGDLPEWLHFPVREPSPSGQQEQPDAQEGETPPADEDFDLTGDACRRPDLCPVCGGGGPAGGLCRRHD